jgi:hypothetical protein
MKSRANNQSEAGSAALVAILFIGLAALTILGVTAMQNRKNMRGTDQFRNKLDEKWNARSNANILSQKVRIDAPKLFKQQLLQAKEMCQLSPQTLLFDEAAGTGGQDQIPGQSQMQEQISRPAVEIDNDRVRCTNEPDPTSIFGRVSYWTEAGKNTLVQQAVQRFNLNAATTNIVEMGEIYRRRLNNDPLKTAYAVRYIVESKNGNYRTRTNGEYVLAADDSAISCSTTVSLEANPSRIIRGSSTTLQATYSSASRLQFFNSANNRIHDENVLEQTTPDVVNYTFAPAVTDTYYVLATGSGGCSAQSAPVQVIVDDPPPVCPTVVLFEASATTVSPGQTVSINWNVTDAFEVTLQQDSGAQQPVGASGTQNFVITAETTFTLRSRDSGNTCPITRTITIRVNSTPPCSTPPLIGSFTANPSSITPGASSQLAWNTSGITAGDEVEITGPNGFSQAGLPAGGTLSVTPPAADGDYTYTLRATNICPDGTRQTVQQSVIIRVRSCPPPVVDVFSATPNTVIAGGNQIVRLSWNISGTADSVAINNGVGGSLPAGGFVDITQPQVTTTYTITAIGCGQTRQMTVTITVNPAPPQPDCLYSEEVAIPTNSNGQILRFQVSFSAARQNNRLANLTGSATVGSNETCILMLTDNGNPIYSGPCGTYTPPTPIPLSPTLQATIGISGTDSTGTAFSGGSNPFIPFYCGSGTGNETCAFNMPSEPICSITNVNNCGPHTVEGGISVNGNTFTFRQFHQPFNAYGQEFLNNVGFSLLDANNQTISTGGWAYTGTGAAYWLTQPPGAGFLAQSGVTITGTIPGNAVLPLHAVFTVGYGANAGYDTKSFDTRSSPGGCGSPGGACNYTLENQYYCDEHTNSQFTTGADVYVNRVGDQTTVVISPPPNFKPGAYHAGAFNISSSTGVINVQFSSDPRFINHPTVVYYQEGSYLEKTFTTGTDVTVNGGMNYYLDPIGGACTIAGSQSIEISFSSGTCIAGLYKMPEILNNEKYQAMPTFLATLLPRKGSCSMF